jgi:hypothetical protein
MEEDSLELTGLLEEANRLRQSNPELADTEAFTDRTVYYYAQQGLLPRASRTACSSYVDCKKNGR